MPVWCALILLLVKLCPAPAAMGKYRETDALAYQPSGGQAANYVSKHKQRNKALEIVFDPKDHK